MVGERARETSTLRDDHLDWAVEVLAMALGTLPDQENTVTEYPECSDNPGLAQCSTLQHGSVPDKSHGQHAPSNLVQALHEEYEQILRHFARARWS